jgi:methionyl-tRNA formyltransferase
MKTIFLGTSWESAEALKVLVNEPYFDVVCVITTPDKPVGRKQIMTQSEVKSFAVKENLPVVHTENNKKKYIEVLDKYKPDIVVCKAFGEIIPKEFLDYPKYGCINIHFSILPKYRGAVPIQKAILDGEKETGISIMLMNEGLDEGDVLDIFKENIKDDDTNITLRKRLVKKSNDVLIPTLKNWIGGNIKPNTQDHSKATYCWQKNISKENAEILWNKYEPEYIERMIRALLPWPIAWTVWNEKRLQIFDAEIVSCQEKGKPGDLIIREGLILFKTNLKEKCISVKELRLEGKKRMTSAEALRGKTLIK